MIAFGFLNPLLLWAMPLAAIPIVIHLLNRRRFDTRPWAAMNFLLAAMKRNRRRLQMEHWLILLLRTLAVILLVLAVSRPLSDGSLFGGEVVHHVIVVDDSASMAHRGGADSTFDRARDAVQQRVEALTNRRPGDLLTLTRSSLAGRPELDQTAVRAGLASRVRELLQSWRVGEGALQPGTTLAEAARRATADDGGKIELYVVTDLRRIDWVDVDGAPTAALTSWLASLDFERIQLTVINVGSRESDNLAIDSVRCRNRQCIAGTPLRIACDVVNRGAGVTPASELTIEIDGRSRIIRPVPPLQPGQRTTIEIEQSFATPGGHGVTASLPADRFEVDDARSLALPVETASRVIIVDGEPGRDAEDAETFFLQIALAPGGDVHSGIDLQVIGEHQLGELTEAELDAADLLFMCNLARPDPAVVARLENYVAKGGGLVLFLGDQVDIRRYRDVLWRGGEGLLPAEPIRTAGDLDVGVGIHVPDLENSPFALDTETLAQLFRQAQLTRWIELRPDPAHPSAVALRIGDVDGPPLLVSRAFGDGGGRVHVIATTADPAWTDLPRWWAFPVLIQELHADAARAVDYSRHDLLPDGVFVTTINPGEHRPDIDIRRVGEETVVSTIGAPAGSEGPTDVSIAMDTLEGYGLFEIRRTRHSGETDVEWIARNPIAAEGQLEPLTAAALQAALPAEVQDHLRVVSSAADWGFELSGESGLWRWVGLALLLGMLLESLLAWRFGRR